MQRVHYFAVGHAFKHIDTKTLFKYELDDKEKVEVPTAYLALQRAEFTFTNELFNLLSNIRNLNSHYVHRFDKLDLSVINNDVILFLKQAFKLSLVQAYQLEKEILPASEKHLVAFILPMFYPLKDVKKNSNNEWLDHNIAWNTYVKTLGLKSLDEIIEMLLFIEVETSFKWSIDNSLEIFEIKKGTYLSFEANLFLVSMFLYKNEANKLISKISGFKKNKTKEERSKRNIFTFFAKKFTSQDVDAEEKKLVIFRDIIQYLNHFPTSWNTDLKLQETNKNPEMTKVLEKQIIHSEINRSYPEFEGDENFREFATKYLFSNNARLKKLEIKHLQKSFSEKELFYYETLTQNPLIQITKKEIEQASQAIRYNPKEDAFKIYVTQYVLKKYFPTKYGYDRFKNHRFHKRENEKEKEKHHQILFVNENTQKLKKRILENTLVSSYGRNIDRFMEFSTRFLLENNYFGKEACIKCYQFYTMIEQEKYLKVFKETHVKKEVDKLKYHQGRLVHFCTYQEHLLRYPDWDMPFVAQNNAISLALSLAGKIKTTKDGIEFKKEVTIQRLIPIQRKLISYFLENALYSKNKIENRGLKLLEDYLFNRYFVDFKNYKTVLEDIDTITESQKTAYKKLFPKRLLHQYCKPQKSETSSIHPLEKLLKEVEAKEKDYESLKKQTEVLTNKSKVMLKEDSKLLEHFLKRNKGKQFKLRFIRKVCNIMYFKKTYDMQVLKHGHHKRFNITKDEMNLFSKWMHAFEGEDNYKKYLEELFEAKGFFLNTAFKKLFSSSTSLDSMYIKVKSAFKEWLKQPHVQKNEENKYKLSNYPLLSSQLDDMIQKKEERQIRYVNVSHFIQFLKDRKHILVNSEGKLHYKSLDNIPFLIPAYYYKNTLAPEERKSCRGLYKKLLSARLEDALLYEIAYRYRFKAFKKGIEKNKITRILNEDLHFEIETVTNTTYQLSVPFHKVDSYVEFIAQKRNEEKFGSFLGNLQRYLDQTQIKKGKDSRGRSIYYKGDLTYADLNNIKNTVLNEALKFSKIVMALEKYTVLKDNEPFEGEMYLKSENIQALAPYRAVWKTATSDFRNIAAHFSLPIEYSFETVLHQLQQQFIINDFSTSNMQVSNKQLCELFIQVLYNHYYLGREVRNLRNNPKKRTTILFNRYTKEVIQPIQTQKQ